MNTFNLEIITPEEVTFRGKTFSLIVPGYRGYLGVMAGHAPFICALKQGMITVRQELPANEQMGSLCEDITFQLTSGFMETTPSKTTILAEKIIRKEQ